MPINSQNCVGFPWGLVEAKTSWMTPPSHSCFLGRRGHLHWEWGSLTQIDPVKLTCGGKMSLSFWGTPFALSPLQLVPASVDITHHISFPLDCELSPGWVSWLLVQERPQKKFFGWTQALESAQLWAAFLFWPEFFGRRNSIAISRCLASL